MKKKQRGPARRWEDPSGPAGQHPVRPGHRPVRTFLRADHRRDHRPGAGGTASAGAAPFRFCGDIQRGHVRGRAVPSRESLRPHHGAQLVLLSLGAGALSAAIPGGAPHQRPAAGRCVQRSDDRRGNRGRLWRRCDLETVYDFLKNGGIL